VLPKAFDGIFNALEKIFLNTEQNKKNIKNVKTWQE